MTATLVFGERRVEVTQELVLGREGDVQLEDEEASRRHARVRLVGESLEIEDLDSRNGTFVNDRRIDALTRLAGGDEVRVGRTVIRVELPRSHATVISAGPVLSEAPFAPPAPARRRRAPASRLLWPQVVAYGIVVATAIALLLYFALR